jgi:hypothetical protein
MESDGNLDGRHHSLMKIRRFKMIKGEVISNSDYQVRYIKALYKIRATIMIYSYAATVIYPKDRCN